MNYVCTVGEKRRRGGSSAWDCNAKTAETTFGVREKGLAGGGVTTCMEWSACVLTLGSRRLREGEGKKHERQKRGRLSTGGLSHAMF